MNMTVKLIKLEEPRNLGKVSRVAYGSVKDDLFSVNINLNQTEDGRYFVSYPQHPSKKTDENGKPVYVTDACPVTKEANLAITEKVLEEYNKL